MIRTRTWVIAGMILCGALVAGRILAQGDQPTSPATSGSAAATSGEQGAPQVYIPVTIETLGIANSAQQLLDHFVKVKDFFYEEVTAFPDAVVRAGNTPEMYYAFRTSPDGSNLLCFVPLDNPDVAALKAVGPPRGTEITIMGKVGPRVFVAGRGATMFAADRVILGHEEPRTPTPGTGMEKKPVILTIERKGPTGNVLGHQEFTIPKPGVQYRIPDPADSQNRAKDIYITLQF